MSKDIYPKECKKLERELLGPKPRSSVQNLINRAKTLKTLEDKWKKESPLPFDHYLWELEK